MVLLGTNNELMYALQHCRCPFEFSVPVKDADSPHKKSSSDELLNCFIDSGEESLQRQSEIIQIELFDTR